MKIRTGFYVGNGLTNHNIPLNNITPDFIMIKGGNDTAFHSSPGQIWMSSYAPSTTQPITINVQDGFLNTNVHLDGILSVTENNMRLGTSIEVNRDTITYDYLAIEDNGAGDFRVITPYIGDGVDNRVIDANLDSDIIIVSGENRSPVWLTKYHLPDTLTPDLTRYRSHGFTSGQGDAPNKLQDFVPPCGFEVGTDASVNSPVTTYHAVVMKEVTNTIVVRSHLGDGLLRQLT